jgi:predicted AAA+ superfamily ATPase
MLNRTITEQLIQLAGYFPVTGIIGPRQVGKTTLSHFIANKLKKNTLYLDLENPRDRAKLFDPVLFFEQNEKLCIILDEIQRMPELFEVLRSMVDKKRVAGRFILLGSASPLLIQSSSESLAGRVAYLELSPFNLMEVLLKNKQVQNKHWLRGGFPNAYLAPSNALASQWHYNFIKTYVERDLPLLGLDIDRNIIQKLWSMVAHLHGNLLNLSNLGKALELSGNSIKRYLAFMEHAFLIRQLQPFSINIKKRLVKAPKIYVRDSGLLHFLLNIGTFEALNVHPSVGNSWEGYAIEQLVQKLSHTTQAYFYRTHEGAECDLVLVQAGIPVMAIEIKYTAAPKPTKGLFQSFSDLKTTANFIITPDTEDYLIRDDVRVCSLQTFLTVYFPAAKL